MDATDPGSHNDDPIKSIDANGLASQINPEDESNPQQNVSVL